MAEYLTKEEIKQWRSSLEKITLEEFAARLGKTIEEAKPTNDLVDMVMNDEPKLTTVKHSEENKQDSIRTKNRNSVEDIIVQFFNENPVYIQEFKKLYQRDFIEVIDNIIESFTFSVLLDEKKTYKDKKSISYTINPSPFDIFRKV